MKEAFKVSFIAGSAENCLAWLLEAVHPTVRRRQFFNDGLSFDVACDCTQIFATLNGHATIAPTLPATRPPMYVDPSAPGHRALQYSNVANSKGCLHTRAKSGNDA